MPVKISHIITPVDGPEEMKKAGQFYADVIGLHVRDGMPNEGLATHTDVWTKYGQRFPDRILHMLDENDTFVDLVNYDDKPICFAKGVGSGKGFALAFRVPDIRACWDKLKDYPVQPVYDPCNYPEAGGLLADGTEPWLGQYLAFCAVDIGRVSNDGRELVIELCEMKPDRPMAAPRGGQSGAKISHVIIPVESVEAMLGARDFFADVVGLHVRQGMPQEGVVTGADIWKEEEIRFPDRILHMMDDYGTFVDLVLYEKRPVSFAKGMGAGKGFALAFQVPDEQAAWQKAQAYPAQPSFAPGGYPELLQAIKEPWMGVSHSFLGVDLGRVSEDGRQQFIEICEMKK